MSIIYLHKRLKGINKFGVSCVEALGGTTIAMESSKPWILETLKVGDFFEKKVGIAKCSKEDRYNKKSGRELAKSRMKLTKLRVSMIIQMESKISAMLEDEKGNSYHLIKYKSANEIFFVGFDGI